MSGGQAVIEAEEVVDNPDSSRTFVSPWIVMDPLDRDLRFRIRQGVPGACRLFGMSDYLRGFVVWSKDLRDAVGVNGDGSISDVEVGHYVESMTCISDQPYVPKITVKERKERLDGAVTVTLPLIHSGSATYRVVSGFLAGVCRLLGYNSAVKYSEEWSAATAAGVSLGFDGQIYIEETGTYLTSLECRNVDQGKYTSPGRRQFENRIKETRERL